MACKSRVNEDVTMSYSLLVLASAVVLMRVDSLEVFSLLMILYSFHIRTQQSSTVI